MRDRGVDFESGLTDQEVDSVEANFRFRFPPDLRAFLQVALPRGGGFPDWRAAPKATLQEWFNLPLEGILFDIEFNDFWLEEWGTRPTSLAEAKQIARSLVEDAPRLIPIYIHRMMPDEPHLPGNPVYSVHQTDIICYGVDLKTYLRNEFNLPIQNPPKRANIRAIRFWDIERFQEIRWADDSCITDPQTLPEDLRKIESEASGVKQRRWWLFWK